jgi:ribokinase
VADVVGLGALNLDLFYEVDDLEALGLQRGREAERDFQNTFELLRLYGRKVGESAGGSASNTVFALYRLGFKVGFCGKVGEDEEGEKVLKGMEGVDLSRVKREGRTGLCLVVIDKERDRALIVQPNVNDTLSLSDLDVDYISRFKILHMSSFVGDGPLRAQLSLMKELPSWVRVSLDPGELYARRGMEALLGILKRSWIIFLTEEELELLTGRKLEEGAKELFKLGPDWVICKRGKKGAIAFGRRGSYALQTEPSKEVVDNTGAGDVFNAGFLAGFLLGKDVEESLKLGHRLALKSLKGFGRSSYPTKEDLCS